jgi:hypothetical protein
MASYQTTIRVDGLKWDRVNCGELYLDDAGAKTGYPTRQTPEGLGIKHAAGMLPANSRLGLA